MSSLAVIAFALIGFAVSWLSVPLIPQWFASTGRRQLHHTHELSICRLGGLSLAAAFLIIVIAAALLDRKSVV